MRTSNYPCNVVMFWASIWIDDLVSISSTFYERIFLYESVLRSFSLVTFLLCNFLVHKNIGAKGARKMLMKLTPWLNFTNIFVRIQSSCQYLFMLLGSTGAKAARRMLMKLTPCLDKPRRDVEMDLVRRWKWSNGSRSWPIFNFTRYFLCLSVFLQLFSPKRLCKHFFSQKNIRGKAARKTLVKLTPVLNFTNILWAAYTNKDPESEKKTDSLTEFFWLFWDLCGYKLHIWCYQHLGSISPTFFACVFCTNKTKRK